MSPLFERDPDRIESIPYLIQQIWEYFPEWRFFQLMANIEARVGVSSRTELGGGVYYHTPDDTVEQMLSSLLFLIKLQGGRWPE